MASIKNILYDKDSNEGGKYLGILPEWDLNDLYTSTQCQELGDDWVGLKKSVNFLRLSLRENL